MRDSGLVNQGTMRVVRALRMALRSSLSREERKMDSQASWAVLRWEESVRRACFLPEGSCPYQSSSWESESGIPSMSRSRERALETRVWRSVSERDTMFLFLC